MPDCVSQLPLQQSALLAHPGSFDGIQPQLPSDAQNWEQQSVDVVHASPSWMQPQLLSDAQKCEQQSLAVVQGWLSGVHAPPSPPMPHKVAAHCVPQSPHPHECHAVHSLMASDEAELPQLLMHVEVTEAQPLMHAFSATQLESAAQTFSFVPQSLADDVAKHV